MRLLMWSALYESDMNAKTYGSCGQPRGRQRNKDESEAMNGTEEDRRILAWVDAYFDDSGKEMDNLVGILQALQDHFGYLSKTGMRQISARMGIKPANVYGVATFYNQFRFVPPGRYAIKVCMGTACAIKDGHHILDQWERRLEIGVGEVTADREYSLDRVDCVGCCTLAPVTVIGDEVIGQMAVTKVDGLLLQHQIKREQAAKADDAGEGES